MKIKELRKQSESQLLEHLLKHREEFQELRFKIANKQLKDNTRLKQIKRTVAQILTILKERRKAIC